jgi:hypothetical protein
MCRLIFWINWPRAYHAFVPFLHSVEMQTDCSRSVSFGPESVYQRIYCGRGFETVAKKRRPLCAVPMSLNNIRVSIFAKC